MRNDLEKRLDLIADALGAIKKLNIDELEIRSGHLTGDEDSDLPPGAVVLFDANQGRSPANLHNAAFTLINSIASIKDHYKNWCNKTKSNFDGDRLIDSNKPVAIIHDLWNLEKHAELNRPPRSSHKPKLVDLRQSLSLSTGPSGSVSFGMNLSGGTIEYIGDGERALVLNGRVVDEFGVDLGDFRTLCNDAIDAWEALLTNAGAIQQKVL